MNRSISFRVVVGLLAALAALPAFAQKVDWPARPVRFIVPFPPGGTTDPMARLVGSRLTPALGQQFIVDNRPGASGSLGAGIAAKETADGGAGFRAPWRVDATRERAVARRV
jgi:tripartite-type tricarboxylate transporter receptor subunit TctC